MKRKKELCLTDLCYPAKGRTYCEEDICITGILKEPFDVAMPTRTVTKSIFRREDCEQT